MSNITAVAAEHNVQRQTAEIIPFNFGKRQVRTLLINDQPCFVATDVCEALAIVNTARALSRLDDDEKGTHAVSTPGGTQNLSVVNESGLYSLILTSRKAEAKIFKKWVTAEVLPAIRKHGRYDDHGKMTTLMDELIGMSELNVIKGLIRDKAKAVPAHMQQSFALTMHNRLHTRFNVPRTELIPVGQFDQACNFIGSYALEGEYLPKGGNQSVDIPTDLLETQRYLVFTDGSGKRQVQPIPFDACVMSPTQFLTAITGSNGLHVPPAALFDFALAAMEKVKWRVAA